MDPAHLYVLGEAEEPHGPVKVGLHYGTAVSAGRTGLSTGNWRTLVVLHHHQLPEDIARWTEYVIHRHLNPWHRRGEWFDLRPLLPATGSWADLLDLAARQQRPGGTTFAVGTPDHQLLRIRMIRWRPPKELIAECSCGDTIHATGTTLPALVKRFRSDHATPTASAATLQRFVEAVNADLAGSYTPTGIRRWWAQPRPELGDRTPTEALSPPFDPNSDTARIVRQLATEPRGAGHTT